MRKPTAVENRKRSPAVGDKTLRLQRARGDSHTDTAHPSDSCVTMMLSDGARSCRISSQRASSTSSAWNRWQPIDSANCATVT